MQVRQTLQAVQELSGPAPRLPLEAARVTAVRQLGMGDRVCVDLCSAMAPGEGLLVGNFCRALFLAHSEVRALRLRCERQPAA